MGAIVSQAVTYGFRYFAGRIPAGFGSIRDIAAIDQLDLTLRRRPVWIAARKTRGAA